MSLIDSISTFITSASQGAAGLFLFRLALAVVAVLIGRRLARSVGGWTTRILSRSALNGRPIELISKAAYYLVIVLTAAVAMSIMGISLTGVAAIAAIIVIFLMVALQQSLRDLAAAMNFAAYQPFKEGEIIESGGVTGYVQVLQPLQTIVRTIDNRLVALANDQLHVDGITNYSRLGNLRLDLDFQISYKDDLRLARKILIDIMSNDPRVLAEPEARVAVLEMGHDGIEISARPYTEPDNMWQLRWDLTEQIKLRFDEAGITFPFAQRDVYLHSANGAYGDRLLDSDRP